MLFDGAKRGQRTKKPGLAHPIDDLLVLNLQLGVALGLAGDLLPVGVVFPGVGRDIGEDGHLVDVGVVFGVGAFDLRMQRLVARAGQAANPWSTLM